jgi:hypothetical protein
MLALGSVGLSGVLALLADATWYLLPGVLVMLAGLLLWRVHDRAGDACVARPEPPAQVGISCGAPLSAAVPSRPRVKENPR